MQIWNYEHGEAVNPIMHIQLCYTMVSSRDVHVWQGYEGANTIGIRFLGYFKVVFTATIFLVINWSINYFMIDTAQWFQAFSSCH